MPLLAAQDAIEPALRRRWIGFCSWGTPLQIPHCARVRLFFDPDRLQELVGLGVARGSRVTLLDIKGFCCLSGRQQPPDRCDARLQLKPG